MGTKIRPSSIVVDVLHDGKRLLPPHDDRVVLIRVADRRLRGVIASDGDVRMAGAGDGKQGTMLGIVAVVHPGVGAARARVSHPADEHWRRQVLGVLVGNPKIGAAGKAPILSAGPAGVIYEG